ncbi:probable serine/threonine-protein kinase At1g09600 [Magnolia sinica]|uniref:probable serine/threonine-protein kinase At1g09600 n=1 Tax=Magnolia sinica TaxID=86752 RepID=UPI0026598C88|nr:probable serine/threonine-protein kinase At1g09600 [Magnolia sinica]
MGCICSKSATEDNVDNQREKVSLSRLSKRFLTPSRREEVAVEANYGGNGNDVVETVITKPKEIVVPTQQSLDKEANKAVVELPKKISHQRGASVDIGTNREPHLHISNVPNGIEGEQVAAGWPSWLASVAGEAIDGWLPRKAESFEKLDKIGQGTYSNVFKARDLETGKIVALKKVRFVNTDPESVRFMAREIHILRRLDHPNVMKLEGLVTSRMSSTLYLALEYMEHDLAGLAAAPDVKFTEPQIKCYMQQLLRGLEHCHSRGVLHRDIKGSNLLIDNNGNLQITDFGLATFFKPNQEQPLTSRVVTLWYRPPELLLGATEYGVAVDLWSTGCILAELLTGKPIMPGRTEVEQMHKIFKLCGSPSEDYWRKSKLAHATIFKPQHPYKRCVSETFKDFPSSALDLLDVLLAIEPEDRGSASSALKSKFFTTNPLPCDPSSLPKYPPSKEYDAKLRDEEARRQKKASVKGHGAESIRRGSRESKGMPAPDANDDLQMMQKQAIPKITSEKYNPEEDSRSGFHSSSHRGTAQAFGSSRGMNGPKLNTQISHMPQAGADLSARSNDYSQRGMQPQWQDHRTSNRYNQLDVAEPSEGSHHFLDRPSSSHRKGERMVGQDSAMGYGAKKNRIHYSGPLLPPGGSIEDMLKEHERQIQQAVRKARLEKAKTKKNFD